MKVNNNVKSTLPEDHRDYPGQQCQDEKINDAFRRLHEHLVTEVIQFCKAYNISIDEFHLCADCLEESIQNNKWCASTDSCFTFNKFDSDYRKAFIEMNQIRLRQEPFLVSM